MYLFKIEIIILFLVLLWNLFRTFLNVYYSCLDVYKLSLFEVRFSLLRRQCINIKTITVPRTFPCCKTPKTYQLYCHDDHIKRRLYILKYYERKCLRDALKDSRFTLCMHIRIRISICVRAFFVKRRKTC